MNGASFDFHFRSVVSMFEKTAEQHPDQDAIVTTHSTVTYKQLNELSNRLAHALIGMGMKAEDCALILLPRSVDSYIAQLGVLKAGGAFVSANLHYADERLDFMRRDSDCRFIITTKSAADGHDELINAPGVCPVFMDRMTAALSCGNPDTDIAENRLAYIIYTSGSSGRPKGVMIEHGNLSNFVQHDPGNREAAAFAERGSVMLAMGQMTFDISIMEAFIALTAGMTLAMVTDEEILDYAKMRDFIMAHKVDAACVTPTYLNTLISIPGMCEALSGLKVLAVGAEAFPGALYTKLHAINPDMYIMNAYGPTETTISCTMKVITSPDRVTIGTPLANVRAYVVDEAHQEVPHGETGELMICGKGVGRGYRNLPEKTAASFIEYNGMRAYLTGDLVRLDENGELEYIGRKDFQIKLRGLRIELGEIEQVIGRHPAVQSCAAKAFDNRFLAVYYTAAEPVDPDGIKDFAARFLARYMVPDVFVQLPAMPMTDNRKIDRQALPRPVIEADEIVPPANDTQEAILRIFSKLVRDMPQSITANILDFGLSSLDAMLLMAELAKAFRINIKIADIYENPTAEKLEAFMRSLPKKTEFVGKDRYPSANLQETYYRFNKNLSDDSSFNLCYSFELDSSFDVERLQKAVTEAFDAHRAALAHFTAENGKLWQIPAPADYHLIPEIVEISDAEFDEIKSSLIVPIDLTKPGPALTARIYLTPTRRILVLNIHHAIMDGESLRILLQDIAAVYDGKEIEPEDLSFFEYLEERAARLETQRKRCREFYGALIPEMPKMRSLTPNSANPDGPMFLFQPVTIPRKALDGICAKIGITPSVMLCGIYGLLYSGEEGLHDAMGVFAYNSRNDTRLARTVGLLFNFIPFYCHWSEDMKLSDYLRDLQAQTLQAMIYADTAEETMKERFAGASENMLLYQPEGTDDFEIGGTFAKTSEIVNPNGTSMCKTIIQLFPMEEKYLLLVIFDKNLYGTEFISKIAGKMDRLLSNVAEDITIGELYKYAENYES